MSAFLSTLAELKRRYDELDHQMADPAVLTDPSKLADLGRERADLEEVVSVYSDLQGSEQELKDAEELASDSDPELSGLAEDEIRRLKALREQYLTQLRTLLVPKDPNDDKNVIVEIRAGTGGEEAALFAADLFRMYTRYAERHRWKVDVLSSTETDNGGFREIIFEVSGKGAYSHLRYESGVHRVQRVPVTESQGRIHTSTASVAVLPEAEEVDIQINDNDLRIDVYRSTGHGGQSVNTTDSAVRITHLPTGSGRDLPGREEPAQEQAESDDRAAHAVSTRSSRSGSSHRARRRPPIADRQRRAEREDPHLQLPPGPHHRSPDQGQRQQPALGHGRQHRHLRQRAAGG